jgi:hypothetical protein
VFLARRPTVPNADALSARACIGSGHQICGTCEGRSFHRGLSEGRPCDQSSSIKRGSHFSMELHQHESRQQEQIDTNSILKRLMNPCHAGMYSEWMMCELFRLRWTVCSWTTEMPSPRSLPNRYPFLRVFPGQNATDARRPPLRKLASPSHARSARK